MPQNNLDEKLDPSMGAGEYVKDFKTSDAPQFKGKSQEKRRVMAIAAYLDAKRGMKEETITEGAYEKSEENKRSADSAKKQGDMFAYHLHMADHHDNLAQWHGEKGRHSVADSHAEKSEQHHEKAMALKEQTEIQETAPVAPTLVKHRISVTVSDPDHTMVSKRKEKIQKTVIVTHSDNKEGAQKVGEKFYKKKGYIVHDSHHAGMVNEEVKKSEIPAYLRKNDKLTTKDLDKERTQNRSHPETIKKINGTLNREELKGNQHKIDKNKNGKIDAHDFKLLRKEEQEQIDELSRDTLLSYANKVSLDSQKHSKDPTKRSGEKASRSVTGYARAHNKLEKPVKEDSELDEAFINGREYASQGVMHPDHAKFHKVGNSMDFYAHGTGDKISGKVTKNDGKAVHIQADKSSGGKLHKFKVTPNLPKPLTKEQFENGEIEKMTKTYKQFVEEINEVKMSDLPSRKVSGRSYGAQYHDPEGEDDADEKPKAKPAADAPKRGRGRPAGSKSGARQIGTAAKKRSGVEYTGYALHLPNK
jgi:hypothetical protein